jgi:hypothetical protein
MVGERRPSKRESDATVRYAAVAVSIRLATPRSAMAEFDLEPMTTGEILSAAMQIYWARFGLLVGLAAIFVVPIEILSAVVVGQSTSARVNSFSQLALLAASQLATAACLKAVSDEYLGLPVTWRPSMAFVVQRSASVLVVTVIEIVLVVVGLVLFFVPGIYLAVALLVATPALLIERLDPIAALQRSRDLTQGEWFRTAGSYLLALVFVALIVSVPVLLIIHVAGGGVATASPHPFPAQVASVCTSLLATPFLATVVVLIYYDLRVRKEQFTAADLARGVLSDPALIDRSRFEPPDEPPYPRDSR